MAAGDRAFLREIDGQVVVDLGLRLEPEREAADPPDDAPHPGGQLGRVEGFGDVVLRHFGDRGDLDLLVVHRGQHDHRQVAVLLDVAAELDAVHSRHHDVDDGEVRQTVPLDGVLRLARGVGGENLETFELECHLHRSNDVGIIVDDEDPMASSESLQRNSPTFGAAV